MYISYKCLFIHLLLQQVKRINFYFLEFLHFFRVFIKLTTHTHHTFSPCPLQNQTTPTILQALLHVKALRNVWLFLVPPSVTYIQQPLFLHANHRPPPHHCFVCTAQATTHNSLWCSDKFRYFGAVTGTSSSGTRSSGTSTDATGAVSGSQHQGHVFVFFRVSQTFHQRRCPGIFDFVFFRGLFRTSVGFFLYTSCFVRHKHFILFW